MQFVPPIFLPMLYATVLQSAGYRIGIPLHVATVKGNRALPPLLRYAESPAPGTVRAGNSCARTSALKRGTSRASRASSRASCSPTRAETEVNTSRACAVGAASAPDAMAISVASRTLSLEGAVRASREDFQRVWIQFRFDLVQAVHQCFHRFGD